MWGGTHSQVKNGTKRVDPVVDQSRRENRHPVAGAGNRHGQPSLIGGAPETTSSRTLPGLEAISEAPSRMKSLTAATTKGSSEYSRSRHRPSAPGAELMHTTPEYTLTHHPGLKPLPTASMTSGVAVAAQLPTDFQHRVRTGAGQAPDSKHHPRPSLSMPECFPKSQRPSPTSAVSARTPCSTSSAFGMTGEELTSVPPNVRPAPSLPPPGGQLPGLDAMTRRALPVHTAPPATRMTVKMPHGQMSIAVDVQGASRAADEKRRRNAGASARFRARRKEKELASSREIDDLKQRIDDLSEDCDFYRQERDVLSAALSSSADASRLFPRPASPRRKRTLIDPSTRSEGLQDSPSAQRFEERGEQGNHGAFTRRRLDTPPQPPYAYYMPSMSQAPPPRQPPTLPPLQMPRQPRSSSPHLPPPRSITYPGFATTASLPASPWQSGYPSLTHSRSQSSTRSHTSGASAH